MITIVKSYKDNLQLRRSFNRLARETFGLDFEPWYQKGFWTDAYNPYSVLLDGEIAANVSVNRTDMIIGGERRRLYQLGTVMTGKAYRRRGYIRAIMAEIEKDIADADGVYLFGGDDVLEFYPKFGFVQGMEHIHTKKITQHGACTMERVRMDDPAGWIRLRVAMEKSEFETACTMIDNPGLIFFYAAQSMRDCVYHDRRLDAWAIAEMEDGVLTLNNVFAPADVTLEEVVAAFGAEVRQVKLGFSPKDPAGFDCTPYHEEDCTFFVKGAAFADFAEKKLRIPSLSHA
ncbi:MAG: GNAT family N-acetyltransferase [Clostridia bacterium]|nr:GNAT family N-acetyltransferase [Clostridia bacterium]